MIRLKNKNAQVTIWVIISIVLVFSIILFFFIDQKAEISQSEEFDPTNYIKECAEKYVNEAVDIILPQGGFLEPENYARYKNTNIEFLCQNKGNFNTCINQHPLILTEIKKEIETYSIPKIEKCFSDIEENLEKSKFSVDSGEAEFIFNINPDKILINIKKDISIEKSGESRTFNNFDIEINSPVYNLAEVSSEIVSQEARFCYIEYLGYMITNQRFIIEKDSISDSIEIYKIKDKKTDKIMNIAIRGCAIPPGI